VERIEHAVPGAALFLDWGGALIWLAAPAAAMSALSRPAIEGSGVGSDELATTSWCAAAVEHSTLLRNALGETGGHATLIRAPSEVRANVAVFHPQPPALAALSKRVKSQFDPSRVLNPGRMYADV
jgi:glycolate oxidase FAD binding subunit